MRVRCTYQLQNREVEYEGKIGEYVTIFVIIIKIIRKHRTVPEHPRTNNIISRVCAIENNAYSTHSYFLLYNEVYRQNHHKINGQIA